MSKAPVIALENVHFSYPGHAPLHSGACFALGEGDRVGIYGANGTGKTTLFRLIMGLETPSAGRVLFHGQPVREEKDFHQLRCRIGLVMQNADDQLFSPTVLEDVAFGPLNLGFTREQAGRMAMRALESVGITDLTDRVTHRLSGGQKKLVSIASVLSMQPEALLLDEPTAFLDEASIQRIVSVLVSLDLPLAVISHDRDFLRQVCRSYVLIEKQTLSPPQDKLPPHPGCCH